MTSLAKILLVLLPLAGSEVIAKWWTEPVAAESTSPVLSLIPPAETDWQVHQELFREVQPSLRCDTGWIADVAESEGPGLRVAWFAWNDAAAGNTFEAFRHLPEQCMGSIGMKLEKTSAPRHYETGGQVLVFDSTQFRPRGGGVAIHVFKCVWVQGRDHTNLRGSVYEGKSIDDLRQLRLSAALTRHKPGRTRVIMGSVAGMPSEELAWHRFSNAVLSQLQWQNHS